MPNIACDDVTYLGTVGVPYTFSSSFSLCLQVFLLLIGFSRLPLDFLEFGPAGFQEFGRYVNAAKFDRTDGTFCIVVRREVVGDCEKNGFADGMRAQILSCLVRPGLDKDQNMSVMSQ